MPTPTHFFQTAEGFHTTRWTRVGRAKAATEEGRRALAELCEIYYQPVAAFLRCELRDPAAAQEATQAFFEKMLGGGRIAAAEPDQGRFRSYLHRLRLRLRDHVKAEVAGTLEDPAMAQEEMQALFAALSG